MRTIVPGILLALGTAAVAPAPAHAQSSNPDPASWAAEVARYPLTMDAFHRWARALENLSTAGRNDPDVVEAAEMSSDVPFAERIARIEADPLLRRPIEDAGLSVREYLVITAALIQAMFAQASVERGLLDQIPAELNPDHVAFVKLHREEIQQTLRRLQQSN